MSATELGGGDSTVVLLHGFPGGSADWTGVADRLGSAHRVIVPDLLGFGRSPRPTTHDALWVDAQARALLALLDSSNVAHVALVGHDYGGPVALATIDHAPDRVTHLVLSATNALPDTPIPLPLSTVTWPLVGGAAARILMSRAGLATMAGRATADGARPARNDAGEARSVRTIFATALRRLPELWAPIAAVLPRISVPTALIWGDRDPFFGVEQGHRTAARIPRASFLVYEQTGHFPHVERPARFASDVEQLLGGVSQR
ncbi:MAG: alpha/beta hydrolase [Actinobacteria bacterium]|nr:alpha/beta hydrolase [Actinomycetota bacterium]